MLNILCFGGWVGMKSIDIENTAVYIVTFPYLTLHLASLTPALSYPYIILTLPLPYMYH